MKIKQFEIFKIHNYYFLTCSIYILIYFHNSTFYVADEYSHFQKSASNENIYLRGSLKVDRGIKNLDDFEKLAIHKWSKDRNYKYSNIIILIKTIIMR